MRLRLAIAILALAAHSPCADGEDVASGLAIGAHPEPLHVRDCTGPAAGKTLCYTCRYAERPTVAVFARALSPQVAQLVKRLDGELGKHREQRLAAYVVLVRDDNAELEAALKRLAKEHEIGRVPLTILRDRTAKLASGYGIAEGAALTVLQWRNGTVAASRGFKTTALTDADIERVVADIDTILD